jgi:Ca2+/H+ antiporter
MGNLFNSTATNTETRLLYVATAFFAICKMLYSATLHNSWHSGEEILVLSHAAAILLFLLYFLYLSFKLYSHATLWEEEVQSNSGADDY